MPTFNPTVACSVQAMQWQWNCSLWPGGLPIEKRPNATQNKSTAQETEQPSGARHSQVNDAGVRGRTNGVSKNCNDNQKEANSKQPPRRGSLWLIVWCRHFHKTGRNRVESNTAFRPILCSQSGVAIARRFRENMGKSTEPKLQHATLTPFDGTDVAVRADSMHDCMGKGSGRFEDGCFGK